MSFLAFFKMSAPATEKVTVAKYDSVWRSLRMQTFLAATLSYALYYVCRLSLGVMKQPIINAGLMNATQLGLVGACLYWTYAVGKLVNGFLADGANIKRFMAVGLVISAAMNLIMGILGVSVASGNMANAVLFPAFALCWGLNGWAQSMGAPPAIVGMSRWFPLRIRGTFYGFFSASHNIGEALSFLFVGMLVAQSGWRWGFFGAALAGAIGVVLILLFLHDTPESKGLPSIEELSGEQLQQKEKAAKDSNLQKAVLKNLGIWVLAAASAFMYMSRYAINEWGVIFLQEAKGYDLAGSAAIISINPLFGIAGTVVSGWMSDVLFKGSRRWPALIAGIMECIALALFLFGGPQRWINVLAMVLFGIAIGVLISFLPGLMAIDLVPRAASGAAIGVTGIASYAAAGVQMVVTGLLLDSNITASGVHDYSYASWFWLGSAVIAMLLPLLNWNRKKSE